MTISGNHTLSVFNVSNGGVEVWNEVISSAFFHQLLPIPKYLIVLLFIESVLRNVCFLYSLAYTVNFKLKASEDIASKERCTIYHHWECVTG